MPSSLGDNSASSLISHCHNALALLLDAYALAQEGALSVWDFAVEIRYLEASGMTPSQLRWLLKQGYLEQGKESTKANSRKRSFTKVTSLSLPRTACFVLTSPGAAFVRGVLRNPSANGVATPNGHFGVSLKALRVDIPHWDATCKRLNWGTELLKEFRKPAPNQTLILDAFEEQRWLARMDDPLPPEPGLDPKRRLGDTIKNLNRNIGRRLLSFHVTDSGCAVCWKKL